VKIQRPSQQTFYSLYGKRLLDIGLSITGLAVACPALLILAVAVKCDSRGPIFFCQHRVGRNGKSFKIWKFRSMVQDAERTGPGITASGDARVTRLGKHLRRWKLDELPQLWNVLTGSMSLVGPRPELPIYVERYNPEQLRVLCVRPGVTDPASVAYCREEELLEAAHDREEFYLKQILPDKLKLNLEYTKKLSLWYDLSLLFRTIKTISDAKVRPQHNEAAEQSVDT